MKQLWYILVFLACTPAFGQEENMIWGETKKMGRFEEQLQILGTTDENFYVFREEQAAQGSFFLEEHNLKDFTCKRFFEISQDIVGDKRTTLQEIHLLGDAFVGFALKPIKKTNDYVRSAFRMNLEGELIQKAIVLDTLPDQDRNKKKQFGTVPAKNGEGVLIWQFANKRKNNPQRLEFTALSNSMEVLWHKVLEMPENSPALMPTSFEYDGDGNVFLLSNNGKKELPEKSEISFKTTSKPSQYVLLNYDAYLNKVKQFDVSLREKQLSSVSMVLEPNGDLVLVGFYSNTFKFKASGVFKFKVNAQTKKTENVGLLPFDSDMIEAFAQGRRRSKSSGFDDFYFDHYISGPNGESYMIGEQYYVTEIIRTDPSNSAQTISYGYHYNDVLVVKISPEGTLEWFNRIPKRQYSTDDGGRYSSYTLAFSDESLYFLFNEHSQNNALLEKDKNATLNANVNVNKSVGTLVSVFPNGDQERKTLLETKAKEVYLRPKLSYMLPDGQVLLSRTYRRNYQFGKIDF